MGAILVDVTFALRTLRRSPLFTMIVVLSLGLGIGANTAIFSLMDQLLLRLLPVKDPESLVMLSQRGPNMGGNDGERANSYPIYQDYQRRAEAFSEVFCQKMAEAAITLDGQSELVSAEMVSGNYFSALGVKPAMGRLFVHGPEYSPLDTPAWPCWLTARGADGMLVEGHLNGDGEDTHAHGSRHRRPSKPSGQHEIPKIFLCGFQLASRDFDYSLSTRQYLPARSAVEVQDVHSARGDLIKA